MGRGLEREFLGWRGVSAVEITGLRKRLHDSPQVHEREGDRGLNALISPGPVGAMGKFSQLLRSMWAVPNMRRGMSLVRGGEYVPVLPSVRSCQLLQKTQDSCFAVHQLTPIPRTTGKLSGLGQNGHILDPLQVDPDPCRCRSGWARLWCRSGRRDVGQAYNPVELWWVRSVVQIQGKSTSRSGIEQFSRIAVDFSLAL